MTDSAHSPPDTLFSRVPEMGRVPPGSDAEARLDRLWETAPGWRGWLSTVDHKTIGLRYLVTAFIFLLLGGIEALIMRLQLAGPDQTLLTPEQYNQLFTMHGVTMIFLYALPVLSGFSNYLWPLMLGSRDMAFPRLNALSYWLFLFAGLFLYAGFPWGEAPNAGWFNYVPFANRIYNTGPQHRCLCAGHGVAGHLDDRRCDQLRHHAVSHARARHGDRSRADSGLGHADTAALFKHPVRISPLRLTVALFGAPVAWLAQLSLNEPLASQSCYPHHVPLPEPLWPWLTVILAAINGACLAAGLLSGFVAWRLCRQTGADLMQDREGRTPFLIKLGAMSSFIFIMALLFTGCSVLLVSPCQPWF